MFFEVNHYKIAYDFVGQRFLIIYFKVNYSFIDVLNELIVIPLYNICCDFKN